MKTVILFWKGHSKEHNTPYIGISYFVDGFEVKKFLKVTPEKLDSLELGEISVPQAAL